MQSLTSRLGRRLSLASGLIVLGLFALIFWLRPWYGVADDASLLLQCDVRRAQGLWPTFVQVLRGDLSWGMFRPLYFFYSQLVYCSTDGFPTLLYLINTAVVVVSVLAFAIGSYFSLPLRAWPLKLYVPAFLLVSLGIYRMHDSFLIAGMQEKLVFFAGALALGSVAWIGKSQAAYSIGRCLRDLLLFLFILGIGFSTKAQFILFLPGIFLLLLASSWENRASKIVFLRPMLFFLLAALGTALVKSIASAGGYTSRYSFGLVFFNLTTRQGIEQLAVVGASILGELWYAKKAGGGFPRLLRALVPASFLASFLAIMAPWSIGDSYIMAPTALLVALCLLSLWQKLSLERTKSLFLGVIALAVLMTFYRGYRGFGRWSDLRAILFSPALEERVQRGHLAFIPCMEGADLMREYLRRYRGLRLVKAYVLKPEDRPSFAIADSALCSLPAAWSAKAVLVSKPLFPGSFALYDFPSEEPGPR